MSLSNPATIYYCPECGQAFEEFPNIPSPSKQHMHTIKVPISAKFPEWCEGVPVKRLLVDPATTREGWLDAEPDFSGDFLDVLLHKPSPRNAEDYRRVLVFDAPKEDT